MSLLLDTSSLEKVFTSLKTSMNYLHSEQAKQDPELYVQFRNSVIQCFEFTYELGYKMLKRKLVEISANPDEINQLDFADLMRKAFTAQLIQDVNRFLDYRTMRNMTSHAYDQEKAELIVKELPQFQQDIDFVIQALKSA